MSARRLPSRVGLAPSHLESADLSAIRDMELVRDTDGVAHVFACSGGKDSTAMVLRWKELHPTMPINALCTPTGRELPEMQAHWELLGELLGRPLLRVTNGTLDSWIAKWKLPSSRARWCTRVLKLIPMEVFARHHPQVRMYVGLRADEPGRLGLLSETIDEVHPLRDLDWGLEEVVDFLRARGIRIPRRSDCDCCFFQRLGEWYELWKTRPDRWRHAVADEKRTGHTFRRTGQDTWPAALVDLGAMFEAGRIPVGVRPALLGQVSLPFGANYDDYDEGEHCRVCSL